MARSFKSDIPFTGNDRGGKDRPPLSRRAEKRRAKREANWLRDALAQDLPPTEVQYPENPYPDLPPGGYYQMAPEEVAKYGMRYMQITEGEPLALPNKVTLQGILDENTEAVKRLQGALVDLVPKGMLDALATARKALAEVTGTEEDGEKREELEEERLKLLPRRLSNVLSFSKGRGGTVSDFDVYNRGEPLSIVTRAETLRVQLEQGAEMPPDLGELVEVCCPASGGMVLMFRGVVRERRALSASMDSNATIEVDIDVVAEEVRSVEQDELARTAERFRAGIREIAAANGLGVTVREVDRMAEAMLDTASRPSRLDEVWPGGYYLAGPPEDGQVDAPPQGYPINANGQLIPEEEWKPEDYRRIKGRDYLVVGDLVVIGDDARVRPCDTTVDLPDGVVLRVDLQKCQAVVRLANTGRDIDYDLPCRRVQQATTWIEPRLMAGTVGKFDEGAFKEAVEGDLKAQNEMVSKMLRDLSVPGGWRQARAGEDLEPGTLVKFSPDGVNSVAMRVGPARPRQPTKCSECGAVHGRVEDEPGPGKRRLARRGEEV